MRSFSSCCSSIIIKFYQNPQIFKNSVNPSIMANPSPKALALAEQFLQKPPVTPEDHLHVRGIAWQQDHRLELLSFWDIKPGSRILELGCGQGDCTVPLADAVGETGHVDAVDPGAPDYGKLNFHPIITPPSIRMADTEFWVTCFTLASPSPFPI